MHLDSKQVRKKIFLVNMCEHKMHARTRTAYENTGKSLHSCGKEMQDVGKSQEHIH